MESKYNRIVPHSYCASLFQQIQTERDSHRTRKLSLNRLIRKNGFRFRVYIGIPPSVNNTRLTCCFALKAVITKLTGGYRFVKKLRYFLVHTPINSLC